MIGNHSWVIDTNGYAWGTGYNGSGQLGLGHRNQVTSFTKVNIDGVKEIFAGENATFMLRNDGTILGTGSGSQLGIGIDSNITEFTRININGAKNIICGSNYTFVLKRDGTVWCTGNNQYGQLGFGTDGSGNNKNVFTKVDIENVKQISCGQYHTFILKKDNTLWTCGRNSRGQLGLGDNQDRNIFVKVDVDEVQNVYCGESHTFILKKDGTVWTTGYNYYGQLGLGNSGASTNRNIFTKVDIDDIKEIHPSSQHTIILKNDGTLWGCGSNQYGQIGLGSTTESLVFKKITMSGIKQVACGAFHTVVLQNSGALWGCGGNGNGSLGLGTVDKRTTFVQIRDSRKDNGKIWSYSFENLSSLSMLLYHSDKYFKLNEDRVLEEVSIATENDFIEHGMVVGIDLITPDINGNRPIDLLPEEFEIRTWESHPKNISIEVVEPSYKIIDELGDTFEVLTYTEEESNNQLEVKALPKDNTQLVIPTSDINIRHVEGIDRCYVNEVNDGGSVKIVCSTDSGRTWKTLKSGKWINIELNKESVSLNGMTPDALGLIEREHWDLITENRLIRFAYLATKDSVESMYGVDKLEMLVDMKGIWDKAVHGTDYRYKYSNNNLLKVELKTDGTYKINYGD